MDLFWSKVEKTASCWLWTAYRDRDGYGIFSRGRAHRISYALANGDVPAGLDIDHLCGVRACVNPDHLEAVTHEENVRRGRAGEWQRRKTACPVGHQYTGMYKAPSGYTQRKCRQCNAEYTRRYRERRRAVGS